MRLRAVIGYETLLTGTLFANLGLISSASGGAQTWRKVMKSIVLAVIAVIALFTLPAKAQGVGTFCDSPKPASECQKSCMKWLRNATPATESAVKRACGGIADEGKKPKGGGGGGGGVKKHDATIDELLKRIEANEKKTDEAVKKAESASSPFDWRKVEPGNVLYIVGGNVIFSIALAFVVLRRARDAQRSARLSLEGDRRLMARIENLERQAGVQPPQPQRGGRRRP